MNLLELVADVSDAAHTAKDMVAKDAVPHPNCTCCDDYCRAEVPPALVAIRGGYRVAAMTLTSPQFGYPLTVAARMFAADSIAVAVDGRDKRTDRPVMVVTAVNRAGDELWRVEPYSLAPDGRTVVWWPAEVPDEHPLLEKPVAGEFVKIMHKSPMPWPPTMNMVTPNMSFEARQACVDIGIAKQVADHAHKSYANISAVSLCAMPGSERQKVLALAGANPSVWL